MRCVVLLLVLTLSSNGQDLRWAETSSAPVKGKYREMTAGEAERIVVVWGKVVMDREEPWTSLSISGQVKISSVDGKTSVPMDWVQPLTVVIVKRHGDRPDWSKGYDQECKGTHISTDEQGRFVARMQPAAIRRPIGMSKPFQIGIALGKREGDLATWTSATPVLKQTISTINIEGPAALSKTLRLINGVPSPIGWHFDPGAVVRAANHLRSLGKEKSIAALREYLAIAHGPDIGGFDPPVPEHLDTSNQWCLAVLVPLVFENPDRPCPRLRGSGYVSIQNDIPFHTVRIGGSSGSLPDMAPLVDWAEKHGKLIEKPLRPTNQPLQAAEKLLQQLSKKGERGITNDRLRQHLQIQAWQMVSHLTHTPRPADNSLIDYWAELKDMLGKMKIRWDDEKQEYVNVQ